MSDRYPFDDGSVVWNEQVVVQSNLDFTNVSDSTLSDSMNEGYVTAIEDNDNETQYLSVLETSNDISLEDLHNLTLGNPKMAMQENLVFNNEAPLGTSEGNTVDIGDQQVIVFSIDGSDDLYGIQIAHDEEGNPQKYQFKLRTTADGQLEAVPESIQLLPEDEVVQDVNEGNQVPMQDVEDEEEEVQETQVILQEEGVEEENVQVTQVYIQNEDEIVENEIEEQENKDVCMYIKGEPEHPLMVDEENVEEQEYEEEVEEPLEEEEQLLYDEPDMEVPQEEDYEEDTIDIKADILEETLRAGSVNDIKQELQPEESQESFPSETAANEQYQLYEQPDEDIQYEENRACDDQMDEHNFKPQVEEQEDSNFETMEVQDENETILHYEQYVPEDIQQVYEETETVNSQGLQQDEFQDHYEEVFIDGHEQDVRELSMHKGAEEMEEMTEHLGMENDSDNDDYQIVEGIHITAEGEIGDESSSVPFQEPETILQKVVAKPLAIERANILKQSILHTNKGLKPKNNKTLVYYLIPHPEKENVNSLSVNNIPSYRAIKSNPRSILKSSFSPPKQEPEVKVVSEEQNNKRFARSKEAVQARLFNNFINKTTIPHAPVRRTRLPRKQEIKPVDTRRDEEIIVQEVMVSSNGFVENVSQRLKNKDKLEVTGYVEVSDSDDDYNPKPGNKRKRKHRTHQPVDMSDSEESDVSVIEINSEDEEEKEEATKRSRGRPRKSTETKESADTTKRRRGRPPKNQTHSEPEIVSLLRKSSSESTVGSDTVKTEIKCPNCTKTFPSQNSLSTHIQHHNLENSLRNSQANRANLKNTSIAVDYKHKCDDCEMTFKNSILLKRHVCKKQAVKTVKRLDCSLCKKTFPDANTLSIHKRTHAKENLIRNTSTIKISPKKFQPRASSSRPKSPKRVLNSRPTFKCRDCSRVCYTQESLSLHEKSHRKFICKTCNATFSSRLLLDSHTRVSCVKTYSPSNRRLSFNIRKTFLRSPARVSGRFTRRSIKPNLNTSTALNRTLNVKVECEVCGLKFLTFTALFKHKVKDHGLETPDKNILAEQKKGLHKPRNIHGGIPAREGMRRVFADIRTKIALITPTKDAK